MVKLILPGQVVPSTPVDAGLQRFLPVEVVREQEVTAAVARGAPVEKHDFDGADPNDLIELTYDDGFTQWISVEQFLADRREEGAQRQARGESEPASAEEVRIIERILRHLGLWQEECARIAAPIRLAKRPSINGSTTLPRLRHRTGHGVLSETETPGNARVRLSHPLPSGPQPSGGSFFGCGRAPQPEHAGV